MKYLHLEKTTSTNDYSKINLDNLDNKTVVYTSVQTNGRGRFSRKWVDLGNGNLFISIVLKPTDNLKQSYSNLTQYTCLKLAKTFEKYDVKPHIKWPNDILINNKKISGILAETVIKNNELKGIIIGVGINLNAKEKDCLSIDKQATALNIELRKDIDKQIFLENFVNTFFENYEEFLKQGFYLIKKDYEKYINFIGKEITITNLNAKITGVAEKITDNGAIIINGQEFYTGDIN